MFKEGKVRQLLIPVLVVLTIFVNFLANALPLNGLTTAEISNSIDIYFVPAGYVFAIWGVIYLGLLAYAAYQAQPKYENAEWLAGIADWFGIASIANIGWIFLWHYQRIGASVFAMIILLVSLIVIYHKLEIGKIKVSSLTKWAVHVPFSIYLGWISVATIANIAAAIEFHNRINVILPGLLSAEGWAVLMVVVATCLGGAALMLRRDFAYAGVLIWAFIGIYFKFAGATGSQVTEGQAISATAVAAAIVLFVLATFVYFRPDGYWNEVEEMVSKKGKKKSKK